MRFLPRWIFASAALLLGLGLSMSLPAAAGTSDYVRDMTFRDWSDGPRFPRQERATGTQPRRLARATYSDSYDDDGEARQRRAQRRDYNAKGQDRKPQYSKRRHDKSAKAQTRKSRVARRAGANRHAAVQPKRRAAAPTWTKRSLSSEGPRGSGQVGVASFYWQPQRLATGGWFNPNAMTAAHRSLPFGTKVRVTHQANGRSVVVTINDRGPYIGGRIIDLSKAAAGIIGMTAQGIAKVAVEILGR